MNKTMDGKRYLKDVAFRYTRDDAEKVKVFSIENDCWLNVTGEEEEAKLLAAFDGRVNDLNRDKIYNFISEKGDTNNGIVTTSEFETHFVSRNIMSKQTLHTQLNNLLSEKKIIKPVKGQYKLAA